MLIQLNILQTYNNMKKISMKTKKNKKKLKSRD